MNYTQMAAMAAICMIGLTATTMEAKPARIRVGAAYRGKMDVKAKGSGSHAAQNVATLFSVGKDSPPVDIDATDSATASFSFGYTGGERSFQWVEDGVVHENTLGSGTIHADRTYDGGDYSATYNDVFFSDTRIVNSVVGAGSVRSGAMEKSGGEMTWSDGDFKGWGLRIDLEAPFGDSDAAESGSLLFSKFLGLRAWWGMDDSLGGSGYSASWRETETTYGGRSRTETRQYDVTAPVGLDGKLEFENADIYEGTVVSYGADSGSKTSTSRRSGISLSRIDAEADLYQVALGGSVGVGIRRWTISARPALLVNMVDADFERTEIFATAAGKTLGSWHDSAGGQKVRLGAGVEAMAECDIGDGWSLWLSGGWEWSDKASWHIGPQKAEVNPSAWSVAAGLGYAL